MESGVIVRNRKFTGAQFQKSKRCINMEIISWVIIFL